MNRLWFSIWRRWLCRHDYGPLDPRQSRILGMTVSWSALPTPLWEETIQCRRCGDQQKSAYILPAGCPDNRWFQPDGPDQWPIHPQTKKRLPMAHGADD